VSFRDWSDEGYNEFHDQAFQSIFNEIPSVSDLSIDELERAEALFEAGWLTFGEYSPDELYAIREEFYDQVYINEDQFDWAEYREIYDSV
jgi:hypothetical protein